MHEGKIKAFINEQLLDGRDLTIENDTSLFEDGVLDSLDMLTLISFLEETFSFKAQPIEISTKNFDTVNSISDFVNRKVSV